jgi:hypothetical protein
LFSLDAERRAMKPQLHMSHLALAIAVALALAIPTQFGTLWQLDDYISIAMGALNFPGIICMFSFGGRFFPPEGYPGESISRSLAMLAVQILLWYFAFSWFRAAQTRRKDRTLPNAT